MAITTVGIMSPGDMGHSVGEMLRQHDLRIVTCLAGRSERTRELAAEAGFEDVPDLETLVRESDMLLSILVPGSALEMAQQTATAIRATGADLLYADCNAVAPRTVRVAAEIIQSAGGRFADAGIIGGPPGRGENRFYASGPGAEEFAQLNQHGLNVRVLPGEVGQASGLKACYAALTKGLQALGVELLVAARSMGLDEALREEQTGSMGAIRTYFDRSLPQNMHKAGRWVSEMEEIATTFGDLGLTPRLFQGVADIYRFIDPTPVGQETAENRDRSRDLDGVLEILTDALPRPAVTR